MHTWLIADISMITYEHVNAIIEAYGLSHRREQYKQDVNLLSLLLTIVEIIKEFYQSSNKIFRFVLSKACDESEQ